ncbi:hypothetical protein WDU94_008037, partial [Cyamophila willieti]
IKRNLQRTYASWSTTKLNSGDHGRALFTLAWFHALVQERRTYIPQGWAKFYEFNDSDLNAALNILNTRLNQDGISGIKWDYIHGLLGNAVYGGRIDNTQDMKVMNCYLEFYFSDQVARNASTPLAQGVSLPSSTNMGVSMTRNASTPLAQGVSLPSSTNMGVSKIWNASTPLAQGVSLPSSTNMGVSKTWNASTPLAQGVSLPSSTNMGVRMTRNASTPLAQGVSLPSSTNMGVSMTRNASTPLAQGVSLPSSTNMGVSMTDGPAIFLRGKP